MAPFTRPDSRYWFLWLETAPRGKQREKTDILIGETTDERKESKRLAHRHYHDRMHAIAKADIEPPPPPAPKGDVTTFRAYAAIWRRDTLPKHRGHEREEEILDGPLLAFFGDDLLSAIDKDRVNEFIAMRRKQPLRGVTPKFGPRPTVNWQSVNREVDVLKGMLREAAPKYIPCSPIVGLPHLKPVHRGEVKRTRRLCTADEFARLLAVGDAQDRALLLVGRDTLTRLGDLLHLRRTDRDGIYLTLRLTKNGTSHRVPLSVRAEQALDAIPDDGPYYFAKFRRAEKPRDWRGSVRQRLEYLCAHADPPVPFGRSGITFHGATRKSGATELLFQKKIPTKVVQELGHWSSPDVLHEYYAEVQSDDLLAAVGRAPAEAPRKARRRKTA